MITKARVRSLTLAIAMLAAACGGGSTLRSGDTVTMLEVNNRSTLDMTVYAVSDTGARDRLGTVTSLSTARFEIPRRIVASAVDVRFAVDPLGSSRTAFSERLPVIPGETVVLEIPPTVGFF